MKTLIATMLMMAGMTAHAQQAAIPSAPAASGPAAAAAKPALEKQDVRAQLTPRRFTTIGAEIGAKISRIGVTEGARFKAGQTLVSFDCSLQQAQLQKAKASLSAAERTYSANKRLAELNSVGKVELEVSEAEAAKAKADVSLMNVSLDKCHIAAPFAGRVAEQRVREQQFVQAGQPLLDVIDDSVLELEFLVPSRWLTWLKAGYPFQIRIDETGKSYPAKITRLGARVDPVSQSIKAAATIDGAFPELMAGMSGKVSLVPPPAQ